MSPEEKLRLMNIAEAAALIAEPPPPLLLRNARVLDFRAGGFAESGAVSGAVMDKGLCRCGANFVV